MYWLHARVECQDPIRRQWRDLVFFRSSANVQKTQVNVAAADLFDFLYIFIYLNRLAEQTCHILG